MKSLTGGSRPLTPILPVSVPLCPQWAGSGRSNHPWSEAFMDCYKNHCKEDRACIARECYSRAKAIIPPLSGAVRDH